jgi:hypothetical protein
VPPWQEDFHGHPIGDPANRPRPTLEGLAEITGKLEEKLVIVGRPGNGGNGGGDLGALAQVLALLQRQIGGDSYYLQGPCERGPDGALLPPAEVPIPAANDTLSGVLFRLDALAALLQAHKDAGQPTCVKQRQGAPVTVILREEP